MSRKEPLTLEEAAIERRHKQTTYRASFLATITSTLAILGFVGPFVLWLGRQAVVDVLAAALEPSVNAQIVKQNAPLVGAFKVILEQQITELERDVDRLQFERREAGQDGAAQWTLEKVNELREKTNKLEANRKALVAIEATAAEPR